MLDALALQDVAPLAPNAMKVMKNPANNNKETGILDGLRNNIDVVLMHTVITMRMKYLRNL